MVKIKVKAIKVSKENIKIKIKTTEKIFNTSLCIVARKENKYSLDVAPYQSKNREIIFIFSLYDISPFNLYYDFYLNFQNEKGKQEFQKIRNNSRRQRRTINLLHLKHQTIIHDNRKYLTTIYFAIGGYLALQNREKDKYDKFRYKLKEVLALLIIPFFYWYYKDSKLIYEKYSNFARDNSFYYFLYVQKNKKNKFFYIIKKDSPDLKNIIQYRKNIIYFMSIKHIILIIVSKYIIASESKGHVYAWRHNQSIARFFLNKKPFVFLQHGVLGLKKVDKTFYANNKLNHADLFITSSNFEKNIVSDYLGYKEKQIAVTGLARWDNKKKVIQEKKIFLMPTWRTDLEFLSHEEFLESDFFTEYFKFIHSEILENILSKYGYVLHFMLHPKFIQFEKYFMSENEHVKVLYQNEYRLDREIRTSELIISDYSSIFWDSIYYNIPTILFQFDQKKYLKLQGSYLNLDDDLSELIVEDTNHLLKMIEEYIVLKKTPNIDYYRKNYFAFSDHKNSRRIEEAINDWEKDFKFIPFFRKFKI